MLAKLLNEDTVRVLVECGEWKTALRAGGNLLVSKNYLKEEYIDAIIANHQKLGPYMVVAPGIVLAHARPEDGVLQLSLSLITLKYPVAFGNDINDPVALVITLGATDHNSHLEALVQLMELLMKKEDVEKIMNANHQEEVLQIIRQYSRVT
ncbi:MAG: putative IIA-like nitrogen-regulatory protein PtsN [Pelosinus sp.]|jgi:PTS system ascorbate-specific IIA component|nr:putative IIA-like nitrogen-regulatory protein PtsN [Pelosinus sp.]